MWLVWVPLVAAWIALPWIALQRADAPWARAGHSTVRRTARCAGSPALVAIACLAATARCWARMGKHWRMDVALDEKTELITDGPFSRIRHPIYAFSVLLIAVLRRRSADAADARASPLSTSRWSTGRRATRSAICSRATAKPTRATSSARDASCRVSERDVAPHVHNAAFACVRAPRNQPASQPRPPHAAPRPSPACAAAARRASARRSPRSAAASIATVCRRATSATFWRQRAGAADHRDLGKLRSRDDGFVRALPGRDGLSGGRASAIRPTARGRTRASAPAPTLAGMLAWHYERDGMMPLAHRLQRRRDAGGAHAARARRRVREPRRRWSTRRRAKRCRATPSSIPRPAARGPRSGSRSPYACALATGTLPRAAAGAVDDDREAARDPRHRRRIHRVRDRVGLDRRHVSRLRALRRDRVGACPQRDAACVVSARRPAAHGASRGECR